MMAKGPMDVSMGDGTMSVVLVDTPGVPDTQGRGVQFLEIILPFVKENPVHGIVFIVNASRRLSAELKLCVRAIKECFNGMLRESRLIIHVNKLPDDLEFEQNEPDMDDESMMKIQSQKVNVITQFLPVISLSGDQAKNFANTTWNLQGSRDGAGLLKAAICAFPSKPMVAKEFRTWTQCKDHYEAVVDLQKTTLEIWRLRRWRFNATLTGTSNASATWRQQVGRRLQEVWRWVVFWRWGRLAEAP